MISRPARILLVDDEPDILEFLSYNLNHAGFEVSSALSGSDGIRIAKQFIPNIIVLDIMMPGMDGLETCKQLRTMKELDGVLIVFLTARGEDMVSEAYRSGADDFIVKPIRPAVLATRMRTLLER